MGEQVSRRGFVKAAGAATGVMIASGKTAFTYAQNSRVKVGCIGTGGQGSFHLKDGLMGAEQIVVTAVCDVYGPHQKYGLKLAQVSNAGVEILPPGLTASQKERINAAYKPKGYYNYKDMIEKEKPDAVVIATPLNTHYQITMDALSAGCFVFCEKTMCYEIEHARDVVKKSHETGKFVQVGHQRRYNPLYNKAIAMAWEEGIIGRINHIDAQWHRNNDWRRPVNKSHKLNVYERKYIKDLERHLNWRLWRETSGGLMTELATHQLDVASWVLDAMPTRVIGSGSLDYWRDGRDICDNVNLVYDFPITTESRAYRAINARSPYVDKQAINEGYNVRVVYSSLTANGKMGCSEKIQGDEGTIKLAEAGGTMYEEATAKVKWSSGGSTGAAAADEAAAVITSGGTLSLSNKAQEDGEPIVIDNQKTPDKLQFIQFAKDIQTNGQPKANVMVGLQATILGLSGMKAIREQTEVKIDPAWSTFDFETPSASMVS